MTKGRRNRITRRQVLRGFGVSVALPWLEIMIPDSARAAPSTFTHWPESKVEVPQPRAIFCYVPNGVNIHQWVPTDSGSGYTFSPTLRVLETHRADLTVISGLGHPNARGGHSGADTWLTGADLHGVPGREYSNSISVDQQIVEQVGQYTRFPSLELSDRSGTGNATHSHTLSFNRNGVPLPAENSPRRLFDRLFTSDSTESREATLQRYAQQRSILDTVMNDATALENSLGNADRQRLEQYLNSVRETELRVARLEDWVEVEKPQIETRGLQLESKPSDSHDRPMWLDVMLEIAYLSFATDMTRVITFEWSREAGGFGGSGENHHELSHHGGDPEMLEKLAGVDRFHLERLNRFMGMLKSTQEGERQMLDHTMIMYGSGMNSGSGGDHSPENLPLLVAGGSAWGLKHGQHIAFDDNANNHPPLSNVLSTIMVAMGIETDRFQDSTGQLAGLI